MYVLTNAIVCNVFLMSIYLHDAPRWHFYSLFLLTCYIMSFLSSTKKKDGEKVKTTSDKPLLTNSSKPALIKAEPTTPTLLVKRCYFVYYHLLFHSTAIVHYPCYYYSLFYVSCSGSHPFLQRAVSRNKAAKAWCDTLPR